VRQPIEKTAKPGRPTARHGASVPEPSRDLTRVLVVDDDPSITELVATVLRYEGFAVQVAAAGREALDAAAAFRPHLMLLDVMLPDMDGFDVQRTLKAEGMGVPVIYLTARAATEDKVRGLTVGGDDYVVKPFSLEELVARIRSLLRRVAKQGEDRLVFADLELDVESHEVWRDGREISLSPTEFSLLRFLMVNPRRVLSKTQILDHVWRYDFAGNGNIVEAYISYLRKKIDFKEPRLIPTIRGVGYSLRLPRS
jgi:two-component system, OmpR family, response regulator